MNNVIPVSVISVGSPAAFDSSCGLAGLAEQGHAPKTFAYVNRRCRPLVAILVSLVVGLLASRRHGNQSRVFHRLLAISGLITIFAWGSACPAQIRMHRAWARHCLIGNMPLEEVEYSMAR